MQTIETEYRNSLIEQARLVNTMLKRKERNPLNFFKPQDYQEDYWTCDKKIQAVFGGNRSGKTLLGAAKVIHLCQTNKNYKARASTWARLSIPIQQTMIYKLLPKDGSVEFSFSHKNGFSRNIVIFKETGSILRFQTYDQGREAFQGESLDIEWNDEEAPEEVVKEQRARLIDRDGIFLTTMTPLDGLTYTYDDIVANKNNDPEIIFWYWETRNNTKINQDAADRILSSYSEKEAEVRSKGSWLELATGKAYYAFSFAEGGNVISSYEHKPGCPIEISCDFNVDIMCWGVGQEWEGIDYLFDEIELLNHANTELMCRMIKERYPSYATGDGVYFYGDISGSQRHPEASMTNWEIIQQNFPRAIVRIKHIKNIKDRVDATNARLCNAKGERRALVTQNCKRHINDYMRVTWEMLLSKTKAGLFTHASDGESYKFDYKYSLLPKLEVYQHGRD